MPRPSSRNTAGRGLPMARAKQPEAAVQAAASRVRPGPRPLALHLAAANQCMLSSLAALPSAKLGSLPWSPLLDRRAAELQPSLAGAKPDDLLLAVAAAPHACSIMATASPGR